MFYKNILCLIIGLIIGVRLTDLWDLMTIQNSYQNDKRISTRISYSNSTTFSNRFQLLPINSSYGDDSIIDGDSSHSNRISVQSQPRTLKSSLADLLFNETRVLCWILTTPANHLKRAFHVKQTWGKRCNKILFMSTENDRFLESIKLNVEEGRTHLWDKTRAAFRYVYDHHFNDADWFLKADDDTFVIMENLRAFLYPLSSQEPVYFGCKFHPFVRQGYMSGGAGYVLSREALRRFAEVAYANKTLCSQSNLSEDKELGICLQNVGVIAGDSRDAEGQERFIPLAPLHLIPIDSSEWYAKYLFYKRDEKKSCCSSEAISFHYIKPKEFYILDYILYHLRPFGLIPSNLNALPPKANMTKLMRKWRADQTDNIFKNSFRFT